jgi:hypothetical protein
VSLVQVGLVRAWLRFEGDADAGSLDLDPPLLLLIADPPIGSIVSCDGDSCDAVTSGRLVAGPDSDFDVTRPVTGVDEPVSAELPGAAAPVPGVQARRVSSRVRPTPLQAIL